MLASTLKHLLGACALALTLACPASAADAETAPADAITEVEKLLFETNHMAGVPAPGKLEYRYVQEGKEAVSDRVILTLDAKKAVEGDYLSGTRHVDFPNVADAEGNPLLVYFLESDVREMGRTTKGKPNYFRRLIRKALASPALKIESTEITLGGQKLAAKRVVIEPFRADPQAPERYPALMGKRYEFILAPELPGQIASLSTILQQADGKTDTLRIEWTSSASM